MKKICVLEQGWVLVGDLEKEGEEYILTQGNVIRKWGTSKGLGQIGLGQIALNGPLKDTILDPLALVRFHSNKLLFTVNCDASKWK